MKALLNILTLVSCLLLLSSCYFHDQTDNPSGDELDYIMVPINANSISQTMAE